MDRKKSNQAKKVLSVVLSTSLLFLVTGAESFAAEDRSNENMIQLDLTKASTFHDTNGDGLGEFEGFGTSLCWWANRIGYNEELTRQAGELFFDEKKGLGMNIGRYNLGGGDLVGPKQGNKEIEFLHPEHIIRSDAAVPGYCVDVTRMDMTQKSVSAYEEEFDRVDETSGFAWNYDWDADKGQMNVLREAMKCSGKEFIPEIFSNSPPYFMTVSGCSSGNEIASEDNLRKDCYEAFAKYMADVIEHWSKEGILFQSATPMNEPNTNYWAAYSNKQEGCHFDMGEAQSNMFLALKKELVKKGLQDILISASDETSIDTAILSYKVLSDDAKKIVDRIDTHTYMGTRRSELKELAIASQKNLWMSEVDGSFTAGTNAGQMSAALGIGKSIIEDLNGLSASAWILWNAIDVHIDSSEYGKKWVDLGSGNDFLTKEDLYANWIPAEDAGYWGLAAANHDANEIYLTKKYYGFGQFSRYIRPGYTLLGISDVENALAAYDPVEKKVVVVVMNTLGEEKTCEIDFSLIGNMGQQANVQAIRTSGSLTDGENWADVSKIDNIVINTNDNSISATLKENSITTYIISDVTLQSKQEALEESTIEQSETEAITVENEVSTSFFRRLLDILFGRVKAK